MHACLHSNWREFCHGWDAVHLIGHTVELKIGACMCVCTQIGGNFVMGVMQYIA